MSYRDSHPSPEDRARLAEFDRNCFNGWYSPSKARYCGGEIYREKSTIIRGRLVRLGRTICVTDLVKSNKKSDIESPNGDEAYAGGVLLSDFVGHFLATEPPGRTPRAHEAALATMNEDVIVP